jgi:hypothetical protein
MAIASMNSSWSSPRPSAPLEDHHVTVSADFIPLLSLLASIATYLPMLVSKFDI